MADEFEIESVGIAEKTDDPADKDVHAEPDIDVPAEGLTEKEIQAKCGTAHIRRKTVNGTCYCQMCCGGTWYYFYRTVNGRRIYQKCGDRARTVSCSGANYILRC